MWDNVITDVSQQQQDGIVGWHLIHNPSRTETAPFAAGMHVASIQRHESKEDYLNKCGHQEVPAWINLVVTEPLDQTKNRQTVAELPEGHPLLGSPA